MFETGLKSLFFIALECTIRLGCPFFFWWNKRLRTVIELDRKRSNFTVELGQIGTFNFWQKSPGGQPTGWEYGKIRFSQFDIEWHWKKACELAFWQGRDIIDKIGYVVSFRLLERSKICWKISRSFWKVRNNGKQILAKSVIQSYAKLTGWAAISENRYST